MLNKDNYIEKLKESRGNSFTFLQEYIKSTKPILCRCNTCNNEWEVSPYEIIVRKSNCPICSRKIAAKKRSMNVEEFNNRLIDKFGYMPYNIVTDSKDINGKITVICKECGYKFSTTMSNLVKKDLSKPVCSNCFKNKPRTYRTGSDKYLNKLNDKFGINNSYTILEEYKTMDVPILHKCNICGYEWKTRPTNVLHPKNNVRNCPNCHNLKRDYGLSYEERLKEKNNGITCIETFKGMKTPLLHKCNICGYEWKTRPQTALKSKRCPKCGKKIKNSSYELEIRNFLEENGIEYINSDRKVLNGKELDIYIPSHHIAIEIDGTYYHSVKYKESNYHLNKTIECDKNSIRLIHIFDDEMRDKKDIVISKLRYMLKLSNDLPRIYARKCYVEEINNDYKSQFLNENHIQGNDSSSIKLGLWYPSDNGDVLVSVMTFCKPRKSLGQGNNTSYDYELSRFANSIEFIVNGSFGKLFEYFKKNYKFNSIITYADRRWSQGDVYVKNKWTFDHNSNPNYWYVNKNTKKRFHRYTFRKSELKKLFPEIYNDGKTEKEIMEETIYFRICDCGNMVFKYIND